jgi:glycosyltransferase involved in cell wall biosynthesis
MTQSSTDPITVSLLVPCHNAARFLPRLWASVRAQTTPFAECIVYDDASTDDTAAVARSLGATVLRGESNVGPAGGRNRLIEAASSPWVHFHDADDVLHPDFVARMSARAANGDADVVLCQVDWLDETSGETVLRWRYNEEAYHGPHAPSDMVFNIIGGIGGLYLAESLRAIGGFRTTLRYWEDLDLHLRLWRSGARIRVVDAVLSLAYRHESSTSNSNLRTVWRVKTGLLEEYLGDPFLRPRLERNIGEEARSILARQLNLGDAAGARSSLELALRAGAEVPETSNPLLRAFRLVFGPWAATRLQHRIRSVLIALQ